MQLVSKISNVCDPDLPTSQTDRQTDGQTDGRHAISIPRYALVHRAVKMGQINKKRVCKCVAHLFCHVLQNFMPIVHIFVHYMYAIQQPMLKVLSWKMAKRKILFHGLHI